mmetsp:Transcript_50962/g.119523  ORF Transcript_50962/g.119523 Transcript_50962/m.119523 type:complete len:200 (-) Transcript_50962:3707-4306(-)
MAASTLCQAGQQAATAHEVAQFVRELLYQPGAHVPAPNRVVLFERSQLVLDRRAAFVHSEHRQRLAQRKRRMCPAEAQEEFIVHGEFQVAAEATQFTKDRRPNEGGRVWHEISFDKVAVAIGRDDERLWHQRTVVVEQHAAEQPVSRLRLQVRVNARQYPRVQKIVVRMQVAEEFASRRLGPGVHGMGNATADALKNAR